MAPAILWPSASIAKSLDIYHNSSQANTLSEGLIQHGLHVKLVKAEIVIITGPLVACSLLSSRTIAPLMQLTMVFSRWQHAKSAVTGLNDLLKKLLDKEADKKMAQPGVGRSFSTTADDAVQL